ncbi:MFS transporter [Paradesulfitobacterium ferrireducens]|uniref:MFS transporter n=1 Tax=Paradesulfitobacterium ferrireducens TaxID=2816476 RepID=UPI001A8ECA76|nr:MFS transporter [Paradesulfitobacterium ferrireducens]
MNHNTGVQKRLAAGGNITAGSNSMLYSWLILILATGVQASIAFVSLGIGSLAPFIESGLGLNKSQVGFIGGAVNVGMTLTALLAGRFVDSRGEKIVLLIGGLFTGAGIMLASLSNTFPVLLLLLFFTGLWAASATPAGSKAIMSWFPPSKLGFAFSVRQTGVPLGGLFSALVLPHLALAFGWKAGMAVMGVVPICGALLFQLLYKTSPRSKAASDNPHKAQLNFRWIIRNFNIWLVSLTAVTFMGAQFIVIAYLVLFLHDQIGFSIALASIFLVISQCGGIIGRIFWGFVSDTIFRGKRRPALISVGAIAVVMSFSMIFLTPASSVWFVGIMSFLLGFSAIGWNGVYVALISELAGAAQAGTAVGFSITLIQLGVLAFPPLFGYFVDITKSYQASWMMLAILLVVGILMLLPVKEKLGTTCNR